MKTQRIGDSGLLETSLQLGEIPALEMHELINILDAIRIIGNSISCAKYKEKRKVMTALESQLHTLEDRNSLSARFIIKGVIETDKDASYPIRVAHLLTNMRPNDFAS